MELSSHFAKQARQFRIDFDEIAHDIEHRGEAGGAREEALRRLLRRYLPSRAGVADGFVIDTSGAESRQLDVIVYDQTSAVVFDIGRTKFFSCETVIAVGQVKTRIDSRSVLTEALDNVASAKALDRSNQGTNLPITGPGYSLQGMNFDPSSHHRDQILGFVFTGASLAEDTLMGHLSEWMSSKPRNLWPNIYCDHNSSLVSYEAKSGLTTSAMGATGLYITGEEERENVLLLFVSLLATFVNEAHVARPDLIRYAGIGATQHRDYPLPTSEGADDSNSHPLSPAS